MEDISLGRRILEFYKQDAPPPPEEIMEKLGIDKAAWDRSLRVIFANVDPALPKKFPDLTDEEIEFVILLAKKPKNKEIAKFLGISENSVKYHIKKITEKTKKTRAELAQLGLHIRPRMPSGKVPFRAGQLPQRIP